MSVSTRLRTDTSTMYEYDEPANPLQVCLPNNVGVYLDDTPTQQPYVARICPTQGHFLIWYTDKDEYPEITEVAIECKKETQSKTSPELDRIDYGQALVYPFEDEVIIGTVKYYGYMQTYGRSATMKIIRKLWFDLIVLFGHKKIICPAGSYMDWLHLTMNQKRVPTNSYKRQLMESLGFYREGNYWIRNADLLA